MTDFCIETTAIHDEYIEEYNKRFAPLFEKLPNTQFICVTNNVTNVLPHKNLKIVDIKKYTNTDFKKRYDHEGGFCEILQATRFGLHEAYELGYLKVVHLQTDMIYSDDVSEINISENIETGLFFDMGGGNFHDKLVKSNERKTRYLVEKYIKNINDLKYVPAGDDPAVLIKFDNIERFKNFLSNLDKLCESTFANPGFTTGIADELTLAMYLSDIKYSADINQMENKKFKFFDVDHGHLHIRYYEDRDPEMIKMRNLEE